MIRIATALSILVCLATATLAETEAASAVEAAVDDAARDDGEIVVTATRRADRWSDVPYSGTSVRSDAIRIERSARTVGDALSDEPGVSVQRTGNGQASPFIRGFTGFRTLLLFDGIRINNSVMREGPNQYWSTVDPLMVDRLELVRGPSSVLFGSDAIGGTVNALSRSAAGGEGFGFGGSIYGRGATAERSLTGRLELEGHQDDVVRVLVGLTGRRFGDLEMGDHAGRLRESDYDEWAGDLRVDAMLSREIELTVAVNHFEQPEVPRTHSTRFGHSYRGTSIGSDEQRDLEQARTLAYARAVYTPADGALTRFEVTVSHQQTCEEQDRIRAGFSRRDVSGFDLTTLGLAAQAEFATSIGPVTTGAEWYHDSVQSHARRYDGAGMLTRVFTQGPIGDDSTYDLFGAYAQVQIPLGDAFELTPGIRFTYVAADSDKVTEPSTGNTISIDDDWSNVVGSLRLGYRATEELTLFGGVSQGFRAPNLSDLTRFDSARSGEIETPSPNLDPENYIALELGAHGRFDGWGFDVAAFHTFISDMIVRFPTGATIDGDAEVRKDNVGDGYLQGFEIGGWVDLHSDWRLNGGFSMATGRVDTFPTSAQIKDREPISRIPPTEFHCGLRWSPTRDLWILAQAQIVAEQDDLDTRDEGDTQRIPMGGTPGYSLFHLRAGYAISDTTSVSLAVENLLDRDYRVHGSGQNGPGRNVVLSVSIGF